MRRVRADRQALMTTTLCYEDGLLIGTEKLNGQVILAGPAELGFAAPSKRRKVLPEAFKIDLSVGIDPAQCPSAEDVAWLVRAGCLRKIIVLLEFGPGTLDFSAVSA